MLPYPNSITDRHKAIFCQHERAMVHKHPECWACSWCEKGSDTMVDSCFEPQHCLVTHARRGNGHASRSDWPVVRAA